MPSRNVDCGKIREQLPKTRNGWQYCGLQFDTAGFLSPHLNANRKDTHLFMRFTTKEVCSSEGRHTGWIGDAR